MSWCLFFCRQFFGSVSTLLVLASAEMFQKHHVSKIQFCKPTQCELASESHLDLYTRSTTLFLYFIYYLFIYLAEAPTSAKVEQVWRHCLGNTLGFVYGSINNMKIILFPFQTHEYFMFSVTEIRLNCICKLIPFYLFYSQLVWGRLPWKPWGFN